MFRFAAHGRTSSPERTLRLLVAASILVPAVVFAASALLSYRSHFAEAEARLERTVDILYEHGAKVFETLDLVAGQVDLLLAGMDDDEVRRREAELHARLKALTARLGQVQYVLVLDGSNHALVFSGLFPAVRETDYGSRDYVRALRDPATEPGQTAVSALLRGRTRTDNTTFLIARRRGEAGAGGIVAISTKPAYFADHYRQISEGDVDTVTLLRADGSILVRHPETADPYLAARSRPLPPTSAFMRAIAGAPERGAYETVSAVDNVDRLYAYRRLPNHPVYVTAGIDRATVTAAWRSTLASHLLFGVPATAGLALLALTALRRARRERAAVERLAARTGELDRVWRTSRDLFVVGGLDGVCRSVNPAWTSTLGHAREDVVGKPLPDFLHPDDGGLLTHQLERLRRGEPVQDLDVRLRAKDGAWHWISWNCVPEGDAFHASGRDVTERRQLADQLRQSQKMEAVGQLTGGVAHDFNNLLTIIRSSVDFLRRRDLAEDRRSRYLDAVADTVDRAAKLTGQLLAFARRQALNPEVFEAGACLREVADMIDTATGARVRVVVELPDEPCHVKADRSQFETALVNLAVNARDAMDGEGTVTLRLACLDAMPAIRGHAGSSKGFAAIALSDTGHGVDPEHIGRIFEPFFTTKAVGKGTGLGLSQVYGFAKQSGGNVDVRSGPDMGTTFTLFLPQVSAPRPANPPRPDREDAPSGSGVHVLVVEDNVGVGQFATQMLEDLGYRTTWAANAEEALEKLGTVGKRFDVVFSDVVMPGMGGLELAKRLSRDMPSLPVLLTSGYSHVLAEEGTHGHALLHKPYSADQLSRLLQRVVSGGASLGRHEGEDRRPQGVPQERPAPGTAGAVVDG